MEKKLWIPEFRDFQDCAHGILSWFSNTDSYPRDFRFFGIFSSSLKWKILIQNLQDQKSLNYGSQKKSWLREVNDLDHLKNGLRALVHLDHCS